MSTHNISFYGELTKIILQLSSNALLIFSPGEKRKKILIELCISMSNFKHDDMILMCFI